MTEMDLKLYEFTKKLNKIADEFDEYGKEKKNPASTFFHSKAVAYREVVELIEEEFRDK